MRSRRHYPQPRKYRDIYGDESWELDALTPQLLDNLVSTEIERLRDHHAWDARRKTVAAYRAEIEKLIPMVSGASDVNNNDEGEDDGD